MINYYILAEYNSNGTFDPTEINDNIEGLYEGLEYGDVDEGSYQIWEYPSGKIYKIEPDRELPVNENHYITPYSNKGIVWLPKLIEIGLDVDKVSKAYDTLR